MIGMVDNNHVHLSLCGRKRESQLFLHRAKYRRTIDW